MKPKKRSEIEYIIVVIALLIVCYFSIKVGSAITDKEQIVTQYQAENQTNINEGEILLNCIAEKINEQKFNFPYKDMNVWKAVGVGIFFWAIFSINYFSSQKNYIAGKEYGTAKWASKKDILDLYAENIMKQEIKQAKQVTNLIGRWKAEKKAYKECYRNSNRLKQEKMQALNKWKVNELKYANLKERKAIMATYKEEKEKIDDFCNIFFIESYAVAWEPYNIEKHYKEELSNLELKYHQGIVIDSEKEYQKQKDQLEEYKEDQLEHFYSGKARVEKIKEKYKDADAIFTATEKISIYNYVLNNNTLILGGSGSGKTRGFVIPNILQAHSSFIVTDPKGEILEKTGYFLKEVKGYKIRVLNLDDKALSDGYNPFVYIHPERDGYEERVLALIETIIVNTDGGEKKSGSDPFWDKAERLFLQALFFFVCTDFEPEYRNMNTVLDLIGKLQIQEERDTKDSELDIYVEGFKERWGEDHIGAQQYDEFRSKAAGKTAKSIVISTVARLAPFRAKSIKRIFSYDSMNLDRIGEEKTAVFVVVPPTDDTFNFIAGMLFTQLFQEIQYCATQLHKHDGQRLPVPVRFILDEFANTCVIPNFLKILAYARSFGVGIVTILQSLDQIKKLYKDDWGVLVDNCNTILYLGSISHTDTLEYVSKLLGKGTFDKRTTGRTKGKSGSSSQNFDVVGRELMDAAEIRKLPKTDCLLIVGGRNPFYSKKYDLKLHKNYIYTSDANSKFSFDYKPEKPKLIYKKEKTQLKIDVNMKQIEQQKEEILKQIEDEIAVKNIIDDQMQLLQDITNNMDYMEPLDFEYDDMEYEEEGIDDEAIAEALANRIKTSMIQIREEVETEIQQQVKISTDIIDIADIGYDVENKQPLSIDIEVDEIDEANINKDCKEELKDISIELDKLLNSNIEINDLTAEIAATVNINDI